MTSGIAQKNAVAPVACLRILARRKPDVVLGGGGYVAGPMVLAAWLRRIPAAVTEADAHLGLANRLAAPFARRLFLAYPLAGAARKARVVGRPIPASSQATPRAEARAALGLPAGGPVLVVFGYAAFALVPMLAAVTAVKLGESTADYSLQNTIEHALFLPTSRDAKYKAQSAIDTVSKRLGDLASTGLVFLGTRAAFGVRAFAVANVVAGLVWRWVALRLRSRQQALVVSAPVTQTAGATSIAAA